LLPQLRKALPESKLAVTEDALYANGPHIRDLQAADMRFIIRIKEGYPSFSLSNCSNKEKPPPLPLAMVAPGRYINAPVV